MHTNWSCVGKKGGGSICAGLTLLLTTRKLLLVNPKHTLLSYSLTLSLEQRLFLSIRHRLSSSSLLCSSSKASLLCSKASLPLLEASSLPLLERSHAAGVFSAQTLFHCVASMNGSSQATEESPTVVGSGSNKLKSEITNDDLHFLLYFIMGTYFGPDIKGERTQKSVSQRIVEGLPPYTSDQLTCSFMKIVELEHVYYHILRKADKSVIIKLSSLRQYFQGNISGLGYNGATNYPQFTDLFPPELHPQYRFKNRYKIIENIVFIDNPETSYIKREDIERFKRLSGLEDFQMDTDPARLHYSLDDSAQNKGAVREAEPNGKMPPSQSCSSSRKARSSDNFSRRDCLQHVNSLEPFSSVPYNGPNMCNRLALSPEDDSNPERVGPAMIFLPSHPTKQELSEIVAATKSGFALTGSAAMGKVGPIIGLMDIGECEDSYLFRVSLPGVKRDESDFSCEVDTHGKVLIRGVTTTGEKTVCRYSQVFEMQTQNLCPPGHFSISFQLPGPVDPYQFSGNFGTDGILEGIVMKGGGHTK
ncbi:increased DNA methylation 2-like [Senna tora]|uniref:Increased DNA methylation 2-like n=1 Tax=Senna tora TaxID=362788 RepID=A0A834SJ39_9FABA|nr:increased DNA methylation 2-like [Senna tora]